MKKLMMFAAAMTIVGGAFAQCGDLPDDPVLTCALVYDVKASLKTTTAKSDSVEQDCQDPLTLCYRKLASLSAKGFIYNCGCCLTEGSSLLIWFGKSDVAYDVKVSFPILNAIGKDGKDAEGILAFGSEDFTMMAAGFGKVKEYTLTSLSGQIGGIVMPPWCSADCAEGTPSVAIPFCEFTSTYTVFDVAAGTWSMKYNKSLSEDIAEINERLVLAGKLPKQIKYIVEDGELLTVAEWVAGELPE